MRKWLVLMVMVAFGLVFLGSGCAKPNAITADDLKAGTSITITWVWQGMKTKVKPDHYILFKATSPLPTATWTQVYAGKTASYTDAIGASKVYFYKVQAFPKTGSGSDLSWPEGGSTVGIEVNNAGVIANMREWEDANNCITQYVFKLYPDPTPPLTGHIDGDTGDLDLEFYFDTTSGLDAVAEFKWTNDFSSTCSNNVAMNGWMYVPVSVPGFNGFQRGYLDMADGWEAFFIVVENQQSVSGHFYASDGSIVSYVDYDQVSTSGCTTCDDPDFCCPTP